MADDFVALTAFLRAAGVPEAEAPVEASVGHVAGPQATSGVASSDTYAHATSVRELTLMRLAAYEAFERAATALLATFAADVLGRELALAPVDVEALLRAAISCCNELEPVTLVLAPGDAARVTTILPVRVDPALAPGDLVVEVRDGAFESQLSFRLTAALARAAAEAP